MSMLDVHRRGHMSSGSCIGGDDDDHHHHYYYGHNGVGQV